MSFSKLHRRASEALHGLRRRQARIWPDELHAERSRRHLGDAFHGLCCRDRRTADIEAFCSFQDAVDAAQVQRRLS